MNTSTCIRAEFVQGNWAFIEPSGNKICFDQAVIDVTFQRLGVVEGHVRVVYGVDHEIARHFNASTRSDLGIAGRHRLGRVGALRRVRLLQDGHIEEA